MNCAFNIDKYGPLQHIILEYTSITDLAVDKDIAFAPMYHDSGIAIEHFIDFFDEFVLYTVPVVIASSVF